MYAEEGGYTVLVPDLAGCVTQGETVEEAFNMAKDAINGWIELALEEREEIPKPSTLGNIVNRLDEILDGIVESTEERERIILASIQIDISKIAA
jgi:antitoxin HicB